MLLVAGPYYVFLGKTVDSDGNHEKNLGIPLMFAILVQLVLSGLFNVMLGDSPNIITKWLLCCVTTGLWLLPLTFNGLTCFWHSVWAYCCVSGILSWLIMTCWGWLDNDSILTFRVRRLTWYWLDIDCQGSRIRLVAQARLHSIRSKLLNWWRSWGCTCWRLKRKHMCLGTMRYY